MACSEHDFLMPERLDTKAVFKALKLTVCGAYAHGEGGLMLSRASDGA